MGQSRVRIEKIKAKDLYRFANEGQEKYELDGVIPITAHRALAHVNNPYADDEDVGLLVAFMENRCIGYLGILPGLLRQGNESSKVHWFSTWYVPPQFRNTAAGLLLLRSAMSMGLDIMVTGVSKDAERIYRRLGFRELGPLVYCQVNLAKIDIFTRGQHLLNKLLSKLRSKIRIPHVDDRIIYPIAKALFYNLLIRRIDKPAAHYGYREVIEFLHDEASYTQDHPISTELYRGTEIVNWMLKFPWVLESNETGSAAPAYWFSDVRSLFRYIPIAIYSIDGGHDVGFMVLSVTSVGHKTEINTLDFNFITPDVSQYACSLILKYAKEYRADYVNVPERFAMIYKSVWPGGPLVDQQERIYFCRPKDEGTPLATSLSSIKLGFCDGDIAFT